jgi:hypothetical protein
MSEAPTRADDLALIQEYRTKAVGAREKAASVADSDIRATLLQIAADYESMANTLKALSRSKATLKRLEEE